jgi:hypothetical protein
VSEPRQKIGKASDRAWWKRENWYRDVWLFALSILVLISVSSSQGASESANVTSKTTRQVVVQLRSVVQQQGTLLREQRQGRTVAVRALCAATSAVIDAGRATITGSGGAVGSPRFVRALERLGYPPKRVREQQAQKAAQFYAQAISKRIETATKQKGLARKDGSLDCRRLQVVANAG